MAKDLYPPPSPAVAAMRRKFTPEIHGAFTVFSECDGPATA